MERELYVYFLKDEDYLKNVVESLENQSKIKTIGLEDWNCQKWNLHCMCFTYLGEEFR